MTSTLTDNDPIPLPAGDLVFGVTLLVPSRHIVTHDSAQRAIDAAGNVTEAAPAALCGHSVRLATKWGAYDPDSVYRRASFCHECAWIVALHLGTVDTEIASYTIDDVDAAAITAAGGDATLGARTLRAIANDTTLAHADRDLGSSHISRILAHASQHLPAVSLCEECADFGVANAHDGAARCPHHIVYCPGCTPTAGEWAGEWEGTLLEECIVPAPCSVQKALAAHYEIHTTLVDYTPPHLAEIGRTIHTREQLDALLHADAGPHGLHGPVVRDRDHQVFEATTEYGGRRIWTEMGSAGPYCLSGHIALPARLIDQIEWNQPARDADA